MRWAIARVIAHKEIAAITRSRALYMPMVVVNVALFVVLPIALGSVAGALDERALRDPEIMKIIDALPDALRARYVRESLRETVFFLMMGQILAPLFLIAPIMTASLVAADAFAGERERKTLEALLYAPASSLEIFAGKVMGALAPALVVDVVGFALFFVCANGVALAVLGAPFPPTPLHLSMALALGPAVSLLAIVLVVAVSARVQGAQEANQVAALLVLPIVGMLISQVSGVAFFGAPVVVLVAVGAAVIAALALRALARRFTRERLLRSL